MEAHEFRDAKSGLDKAGGTVIGVSPDPVETQAKFKAKHDLPFSLLADFDHVACEAYGVWVEKSMYGKKYMGVERTTFVIDKDGKIAKIFSKVKPAGHAAEVEAILNTL